MKKRSRKAPTRSRAARTVTHADVRKVSHTLQTHAVRLDQLQGLMERLQRDYAVQVHRTAQLQAEVDRLKKGQQSN